MLIDAKNGRVLFEHSSSKHLPMASTTKIMTALLTLEETGLDGLFTVDSTAIMVEGSSMGLLKGDRWLCAGFCGAYERKGQGNRNGKHLV